MLDSPFNEIAGLKASHRFFKRTPPVAASESCHLTSVTFTYPIGKKNPVKSDQFFSCDRYFYPTNNFTLLKLTQTKHFYLLLFLLNKNQIREILKKNYQIYYWLSEVGWGSVVKKGNLPRLISQSWSVALAVVVRKKKKTSTLT